MDRSHVGGKDFFDIDAEGFTSGQGASRNL